MFALSSTVWTFSALLVLSTTSSLASADDDTFASYLSQRSSFLEAEERLSINSVWTLTPEEQRVEELLLSLKSVD